MGWLLVTVVLTAASCGSSGLGADAKARSICQDRGAPYAAAYGDVQLIGSVPVTASQVEAWAADIGRDDASAWGRRPANEQAALCYFDGEFSGFPVPPGFDGKFDRIVLLVPATGDPSLIVAGERSKLPVDGLDTLR